MPDEHDANQQAEANDLRHIEQRDAFQQAVQPHLDMLDRAARDDLDYYAEQGLVHENDFTPEEIVGETLVYAWEHRARQPEGMSLRGWLLGTQHHVTRGLVDDVVQYRRDKAISLEEEIPPDARGRGEQARHQYAWKPEMSITWEDVTPGRAPRDIEAPVFTNRDTFTLDPDTRHVVMMHHEFDVPLPEVAAIMHRTIEETAAVLEQARTTLRQRIESPPSSESPGPSEAPPPPEAERGA